MVVSGGQSKLGEVKNLRIKQPRSLTELVVERLREAIIEGQFALGENISEDKLAEAFGVSRTPVRDALMQLQQTGLVIVRPKRGSFVFSPTLADVEELCEYRLMLETQALKLSIDRNFDGVVHTAQIQVDAMSEAQESGDQRGYARADTAFHRSFFDHCGNRFVQEAFQLAEGRLATLRTVLTVPYRQRRDASYDEHRQIVEIIKAKDVSALHRILEEHIGRTLRVAQDSLPVAQSAKKA
jgi:DNA-binding GntR family transcriptional regulator